MTTNTDHTIIIRKLGTTDYLPVWQAMQEFTLSRAENTIDELWFVEHPAVFTLGRNGKAEHIHDPHGIPVIQVDRGGQVTYHGPGQLVAYPLINIQRRKMGIRGLVDALESSVIEMLAELNIHATTRAKAPGVYVHDKKIAALGLRVRRGCVYHGLSININMDLKPFAYINPCGYPDLEVTQLADLANFSGLSEQPDLDKVAEMLTDCIQQTLGYQEVKIPEQTISNPMDQYNEHVASR